MAERSGTTPYWTTSATFPRFAKLAEDLETEVLVVGAGMTGLSVAYLLAKAGKQVVVVERDRCAMTDTGHTSAHLTMVSDTRMTKLVRQFGRDHAQAVWDAGLAAIARIEENVRELAIDCAFERVDGYLHAPPGAATDEEIEKLREDAKLARELGFDAEDVDAVPLFHLPGIRFAHQARFHPRRYLAGLAKAFVALGGRIYENSAAGEFCSRPHTSRSVKVGRHTVQFENVVIATHNPLVGLTPPKEAALFQTKLALYTSYVIAGRVPRGAVADESNHELPDALWWDTADPYAYLRVEPHRDHQVAIFGGEDYKTGQKEQTLEGYLRLEARLRALCPSIELTHRWSGQVILTPDGLPYIGRSVEHQYIATGFVGNGLTFGTLAGILVADSIAGRANPWTELFEPGRKALTRGLWDYLKENADYPYYKIRDRFAGADSRSLRAVKRGHGAIVERQGEKVAAYRDPDGKLTLRSALCPHMGCAVTWNTAERTWDCPCHGSRFRPTGEVISGPAEAPLAEV